MSRLHVVGVGNRLRADDGAGLAVLDRLRQRTAQTALPGCELFTSDGDVAELVQVLSDCDEAIIIDALNPVGSLRPGELMEFGIGMEGLEGDRQRASSHGLGVLEAVRLAEALGDLPGRVTVWGIVGDDFGLGERLTPGVASAVERLDAALWKRISRQ